MILPLWRAERSTAGMIVLTRCVGDSTTDRYGWRALAGGARSACTPDIRRGVPSCGWSASY